MLANVLAVIIGAGSLAFYLVAFVLPEVHRRSDFFWSGIGMFYAVVLWYCARQMSGAVLLGQTASVGLLLWLGYQTLLLRRETTPAAQQTPIRFGKAERDRTASRPIAKDYEFVEDGVEDALAQEPAPDSPIFLKPAADQFAPKMVVPAAMPKPIAEKDEPEKSPTEDIPAPSQPSELRAQPSPLAAVGIFISWLKDVVTPKQKEPKPMIELPPRPPSIPKPNAVSKLDSANATDSTAKISNVEPPEITAEKSEVSTTNVSTSSAKDPSPIKDPVANPAVANAVPEIIRTPSPAATHQEEEDSNWPDDEFWD
ncbi:MAG: Ycf66 family protein [Cyanobacteria bacterium P01_B01_bin.77]